MSFDLEYYRERARRERELAEAASNPKAAAAHAALADQYDALVTNNQRPTARILKPDFQKRGAGGRRMAGSGAMESEG